MITLKEFTKKDENIFTEFEREYKATCGGEKIPFLLNPDNLPFERFWKKIAALKCEETCPDGMVPSVSYFIMNDGVAVGAINLRYKSNDFILNVAGHIGYGILPRFRGKGYATEALGLCLLEACKMGLKEVVVTTDLTNVASQQVILKNHGKLARIVDGKKVFEIRLSDVVSIEHSAMAVVFCNGKILTTQENVYGALRLSLPKGHLESGETVIDAAIRECREETNVVISKDDFVAELESFVIKFTTPKGCRVEKVITPTLFVILSERNPKPREERIKAVEYLKIDDFLQNCSYENVREVVRSALQKISK